MICLFVRSDLIGVVLKRIGYLVLLAIELGSILLAAIISLHALVLITLLLQLRVFGNNFSHLVCVAESTSIGVGLIRVILFTF